MHDIIIIDVHDYTMTEYYFCITLVLVVLIYRTDVRCIYTTYCNLFVYKTANAYSIMYTF